MYAHGIEDTLPLAIEGSMIIWEKIGDGGEVVEELRKLYSMVLYSKLPLIRRGSKESIGVASRVRQLTLGIL